MKSISITGLLLVVMGSILNYTNGATIYNNTYGGTCGTCTDNTETCSKTSVVIGEKCPDSATSDISCQSGFNSTRGVNNMKKKSYTMNSYNCGGYHVICTGGTGEKVWTKSTNITDSSCGKTYTCKEDYDDSCEKNNQE